MTLNDIPSEILTALLTGTVALVGIFYTQRQATKREDVRDQRSDVRADTDRVWQQTVWAQEHRREAHVAFLAEQRRLDHWMMMVTRVNSDDIETPKEDWAATLGRLLVDVQVFAGQDAAVAAQRLYKATLDLESGQVGPMMTVDNALEIYRILVQRDLGLAETTLPRWGSQDSPPWDQVGVLDNVTATT